MLAITLSQGTAWIGSLKIGELSYGRYTIRPVRSSVYLVGKAKQVEPIVTRSILSSIYLRQLTGLPRDPPLAAFGHTQAQELADYFLSLPEEERPTAIFSSPYCKYSVLWSRIAWIWASNVHEIDASRQLNLCRFLWMYLYLLSMVSP